MADKRIFYKIADEVLDLIDSGVFPVGSRLPGERHLATRFGVSRPCIREAKVLLQAQGYLDVEVGAGTYVIDRAQSDSSDLAQAEPLELIEAQTLIEAESAALAAPIITDDIILKLEALVAIICGRKKSDLTEQQAEAAFHTTIASATNNHVIMFIVDSMCKMRPQRSQLQNASQGLYDVEGTCLEGKYLAILEAFRNKNPVAARKAMRDHFTHIIDIHITQTEEEAFQEMRRKTSEIRARFLLCTQLH